MPGKLGLGGAGWMCRWGIDYRRWRSSVVTEWRRLWRLRQRAHERTKRVIYCIATEPAKAAHFAKTGAAGGHRSVTSGAATLVCPIHETQNDREVVSLYAHLVQQF